METAGGRVRGLEVGSFPTLWVFLGDPYPKALRTHILWLLGAKTIPCSAFGLF